MEDMPDIHTPTSFGLGEETIEESDNAVIRVIGVGGGGGNAVNYMLQHDLSGVDFIVANTDKKALKGLEVTSQIRLGQKTTKGLGAGSSPEVGEKAALEDEETIRGSLSDSDMVFVTVGMGGGTGTGAAPIVARLAKESGALTVAVVTKPFKVEGQRKIRVADKGLEELASHVDALIVIPNQKLMETQKNISLIDGFALSNNVLLDCVQGISELITKPGLMGIDFADVRAVMSDMGSCIVVCGEAKSSPSAARDACMEALRNPLLEDAKLEGAKGVLVNITGSENLSMRDYEEIGEIIETLCDEEALVKIGAAIDETLADAIRVTVVMTGIEYSSSATEGSSSSQESSNELSRDRFRAEGFRQMPLKPDFQASARSRQDAQARHDSQPKKNDDIGGLDRGFRHPHHDAPIDIPAYMRKRQLD